MDGTVLISVVGTLGGAFIGVRGALAISRAERRAADAGEIRRAYAAYLGAIYSAVARLRDMPPSRPQTRRERLADRLVSDEAMWLLTQRNVQATFGDGLRQLTDRVTAAVAYLQVLPLPSEVRETVDAGTNT